MRRQPVKNPENGYEPTEIKGRPVKVVAVPYATSNSGVALFAPVTISRAPWDDDETDN